MVKKLSCVSCGSLKRFPHTFTSSSLLLLLVGKLTPLYTFFLTPCRPEGHEIRHQEIIMIPSTLEHQIILG